MIGKNMQEKGKTWIPGSAQCHQLKDFFFGFYVKYDKKFIRDVISVRGVVPAVAKAMAGRPGPAHPEPVEGRRDDVE